jgi:DNA-binding PadR family transcriptional regulator
MKPIERLKKSNTVENLWMYVLALLETKPLYGWEIPDLIEKEFGFRPGKITPYRVLYRLEIDKFVTSSVKERRRIYEISALGKKELLSATSLIIDLARQLNGKRQ